MKHRKQRLLFVLGIVLVCAASGAPQGRNIMDSSPRNGELINQYVKAMEA
jgi:hypothetical protein